MRIKTGQAASLSPFLPFSLPPSLCTCGLALILLSCGGGETATSETALDDEAEITRTNIRLAKRNAADLFVEGTEFTRDTDHTEQIMPAIYQNEGPAWENENIAFRMYWDQRNGIDIHGKKVRDMVLDTVGLDRNTYHEMADWGMDVLKAGNSLGAGTIAFLIDGQVYRLGDAAAEKVTITEETAKRSAFLLEYRGLEIAGRTINLDWAISIEAGTHGYESTVTATGLTGGEALLIGIVNLHSDTLYTTEKGDRFVAYTHGPQAELEHFLGMAVSVDKAHYLSTGELAPDAQPVASTYYVRAKLDDGQPTMYRFTAGWAPGHAMFKDRMAFEGVIR